MTSTQIRETFFSYFKTHNHHFITSSKVFIENDPTLLFVNAGMNQFKNIFLGLETSSFKRVYNSQKCLRVSGKHNDLDEVGTDNYHHTFFEMLGTWSFGDYYKKDAIHFCWDLMTNIFKLSKENFYITIFNTDEESYSLWKNTPQVDETHILRFGEKHNFWEMGNQGLCGPCTEIHYDFGENACNKKEDKNHICAVNGDCERYIELWNVVFMTYNRLEDGSLQELTQKYVDTGMGLERLCRVLQDKKSNYETDLFWQYIEFLEKKSGFKYHQSDREIQIAMCVIADHIRALVFAIGDGVVPSNTSRGYVIRRILRRAVRYGRTLNLTGNFLSDMTDIVIQNMSETYTDLKTNANNIREVVKQEEEKFSKTLDKGLVLFEKEVNKLEHHAVLSGKIAFTLYDTYGFPLDLTMLLAKEKNIEVDIEGFNLEMEQQKILASQNQKFSGQKMEGNVFINVDESITETEFLGYEHYHYENSKVTKYKIKEDGKISLVLDKTPFYAESGGQLADNGLIFTENMTLFVSDVQKMGDEYVHEVTVVKGKFDPDAIYKTQIDESRRNSLKLHHSSVHILHEALKRALNIETAEFRSTFVGVESFTCDFPFEKLTREQIYNIEVEMNQIIQECHPVKTHIMPLDEVHKMGIKGRFEGKYKETVRFVDMGEISKDLCGGTHIKNTGEIGVFKLLSDISAGAGIRRLEGVSGMKALTIFHNLYEDSRVIAGEIKVSVQEVPEKTLKILEDIKTLKKQLKEVSKKNSSQSLSINDVLKIGEIKSIPFYVGIFDGAEVTELRRLFENLESTHNDCAALLLSVGQENNMYNIGVSKSAFEKGIKAEDINAVVLKLMNAKGGGKSFAATGSYKIPYTPEIENELLKVLEK